MHSTGQRRIFHIKSHMPQFLCIMYSAKSLYPALFKHLYILCSVCKSIDTDREEHETSEKSVLGA